MQVQILPALEVDLPYDGDISHRLPNVVACEKDKKTNTVPQDNGLTPEECKEQSFEPEEIVQEQTTFIPSSLPGPTELDSIRSKMRSSGDTLTPVCSQ